MVDIAEVEKRVTKVLNEGKLGYFSSYSENLGPRTFQAWFACDGLRNLFFASRFDRNHSQEVDQDPRFSGAITANEPNGLGEQVVGVSFQGTCAVLSGTDLVSGYEAYANKWNRATELFSLEEISQETSPMRLYGVSVDRWVLFDESLSEGPRHTLNLV